jgi:hypothetical protein
VLEVCRTGASNPSFPKKKNFLGNSLPQIENKISQNVDNSLNFYAILGRSLNASVLD